jgi:tetratricopeptide (TPR) repeat protein
MADLVIDKHGKLREDAHAVTIDLDKHQAVVDKNGKFRNNAHAVIIGINKYHDENIPNLNFACADAEGIYQVLTDPELGRIPPENVILLLDENATQQNIRSAIGDEIPRRAGEHDLVYIYFAGHGLPFINPRSGSADGMEKYLVPVDAKLDKIRGTGIPMDDIQRFFGYIQSKQVMFFIDSCFSGEAGGRTFQNPAYQTRHGLLTTEFLDKLSGEGRLVVTACDVNELSIETSTMGHGLFTHYLMEGLKGRADKDQDGTVSVYELYEYVYDKVSQAALRVGGSMHPIQKGSVKGKIILTQYETPAQKKAKALHLQAQSFFDAEKFNEAYELWQAVLKLVPKHEAASFGIAAIEGMREKAWREQQEALKRRQKALLRLRGTGKFSAAEFNHAMSLLEKSRDELSGNERPMRELLDDLADGKISAENYIKSVRLLRDSSTLIPDDDPKLKPIKKIGLQGITQLFKNAATPKKKGAAPSKQKSPEQKALETATETLEREPITVRLRNSLLATMRTFFIAAVVALSFSGLTIYAVFYFQQSSKIGVLSKYTIVIYFPQNDRDLAKAATDIKIGLVKYGLNDRMILPQEVSEAFLKAVVPPKGDEIRYQLSEVEAATKLKSVLTEIYRTRTFATRVAQGKDKQNVISIFLVSAAGKIKS